MSAPSANQFVPFDPVSKGAEVAADNGFRLTTIGRTDPPSAANTRGDLSTALSSLDAPNPASPAAHGQPVLKLQREGDKVTGVHIECGCGQVIELECVYETRDLRP